MDVISCMQRAIDFIEDNLCDGLNIDTIAIQAFMSPFHF